MKDLDQRVKEDLETMCHSLKELRRWQGLSKKEMAKKLKINISSLSKIEKGEMPSQIPCTILLHIYNEFNILPDDLLTKEPRELKQELTKDK